MRHKYAMLFALAAALLLIAGCAAKPTVQQVRPMEVDLARYSGLQVIVDAPQHIRSQTGYAITASELRREFIANVSASGKFDTVGAESGSGRDLEARLTITDFNYVSGAARGMAGVFGGRAILHVTMEVSDKETGTVVGSVSAGHTSSHAQGAFSPVTSRQITAIANELAASLP